MRSRINRCARNAAPLIGLVILMAAFVTPEKTSAPDGRSSQARPAAASDTIRASAVAGDPLIIDLPGDSDMSLLRAPALSWLIERSFMWRTTEQDTGTHEILFQREIDGAVDTLVLQVHVESP